MSVQGVSTLTPKCSTDSIEVRIIKKWKMYLRPELHLLFVDEHGDAIEATTDVHSATHFNDLIRPKACYRITGFVCIEQRTSSNVVDRDAIILFGKSTTVTPIENNAIPYYYFAFASYSELQRRLVDKNKLLTDFIGRYISAKEIAGHSRKGPLRIRLQHERLINRHASALQLASTSATEVYINPCIAQLPTLIQRFKHLPTTEVPSPPTRNRVAESNLTLLSEVLNQLQQTKRETPYTCLARIAKIEGGWYYESCIKCAHKAYQSGHKHYCPAHGFQDEHSYRYRFSATIADDSCTADAIFFDGVITTLVGKTCYDIITAQSNIDQKQLPPELEDLINKPYIFEIQVKKDSQTEGIAVNNAYEAPPSTTTTEAATSSQLHLQPHLSKHQKEHVNKMQKLDRNRKPLNSDSAQGTNFCKKRLAATATYFAR